MTNKLIEAAQAVEAEKYRRAPKASQNDDDRLLDLYLATVLGEGGKERVVAFRTMRRIVARLRRESDDCSFTTLVAALIRSEASARGWL
mgnify:FL=1